MNQSTTIITKTSPINMEKFNKEKNWWIARWEEITYNPSKYNDPMDWVYDEVNDNYMKKKSNPKYIRKTYHFLSNEKCDELAENNHYKLIALKALFKEWSSTDPTNKEYFYKYLSKEYNYQPSQVKPYDFDWLVISDSDSDDEF